MQIHCSSCNRIVGEWPYANPLVSDAFICNHCLGLRNFFKALFSESNEDDEKYRKIAFYYADMEFNDKWDEQQAVKLIRALFNEYDAFELVPVTNEEDETNGKSLAENGSEQIEPNETICETIHGD